MQTINPAARLEAIIDTVRQMQRLVNDATDRYDRADTPARRAAIAEDLQAAVQAEADAIGEHAADFDRLGITHE